MDSDYKGGEVDDVWRWTHPHSTPTTLFLFTIEVNEAKKNNIDRFKAKICSSES